MGPFVGGGDATISTTPPTITINGDNPAIIQEGATYADPGALDHRPDGRPNLGIRQYVDLHPHRPHRACGHSAKCFPISFLDGSNFNLPLDHG
jgi:hypothetical protein